MQNPEQCAYRNEREFRIFGMRRTGQHGIIAWIGQHFPAQSVHFINDVIPGKDPFVHHCNTRFTTSKLDSFVHRKELDIATERDIFKRCLIYNYEDKRISRCDSRTLLPDKENTVGKSDREFNVLILRDPFNLAASRLQMVGTNHPWFKRTLDLWVPHAKEFLGITNYLDKKVCVNFNQWFLDVKYRRNLSSKLGIEFTDAGLNRVPRNGGGSSWDRTGFDRNAQRMSVLDRWLTYSQDRAYRALFLQYPVVRELSRSIFGNIPGTDALFNQGVVQRARFRMPTRSSRLLIQ